MPAGAVVAGAVVAGAVVTGGAVVVGAAGVVAGLLVTGGWGAEPPLQEKTEGPEGTCVGDNMTKTPMANAYLG